MILLLGGRKMKVISRQTSPRRIKSRLKYSSWYALRYRGSSSSTNTPPMAKHRYFIRSGM